MIGRAQPRRDPRVRLVGRLAGALAGVCAFVISPGAGALLLVGLAATWLLVPAFAAVASRRGATVLPGGRSIHADRTPLLGGLAIFVPVVAYLLAVGGAPHLGLAAGCTLMACVGALDDLRGVSPRVKIAAQVVAALLLFATGFRVPALEFPGLGTVPTTGFELLVLVFWVVLATNAVNLIDGMDGLAATLALVGALACAALGFSTGPALVAAGGLLAFLRFNLPQARIFLGDAGSLPLGFLSAALLVDGAGPVNVPLVLGLLAVPLGDVALSTVRRWLRGKPIFTGDRGHVHHLLLDSLGSPGRALAALAGLAVAQACVVGVAPDVLGLVGVAGLWGLVLAYLMVKRRHRWTRILLNRRAFRRIHVVREYAAASLRLAESRADVESVLGRVADDLRLVALRLRGLRVERPKPPGCVEVEEHVDCGRETASWSALFVPGDQVLAEEQRTVLCELLRRAVARLDALEPATEPGTAPTPEPAPVPERAPVAPARPARPAGGPRVHFIADGRARLARVSALARETRRRGALQPVVVYTGRRDDLGLTDAQLRELGLEHPGIELDVSTVGEGIVYMARVMEQYNALVAAEPPAVVVVGDSRAGVACALVAKELGLAVAHVGAPGEPAGTLAEAMADVVLATDRGVRPIPVVGAGRDRPLLFLDDPGTDLEASAARIVPAIEALLV